MWLTYQVIVTEQLAPGEDNEGDRCSVKGA